MPEPATPKRKPLPREQLAVAERLRGVREQEDFSVSELARESGLSKWNLANWLYERAPMPFVAGNEVCRRLNLNQRWLATGVEPRRPFVDVSGFAGDDVQMKALGTLTFHAAITGPLREGFEQWLATHDNDKLIAQTLREGIASVMLRASDSALEAMLSRFVSELRDADSDAMRMGHLEQINAVVAELRRRSGGKVSVDEAFQVGTLGAVQTKERIAKALKKLGLSQKDAAAKWGVPLSTFRKWACGASEPRGLGLVHLETILRKAGV